MRFSSSIDVPFLMAFGIPGFGALHAASYFSKPIDKAMGLLVDPQGTIGNAAVLVVSAFAAGFIVSGIRAAVLDPIHYRTGVQKPTLSWQKLTNKECLEAFREGVNMTFRFYQFYGNTLITLILVFAFRYWPGHVEPNDEWATFWIALAIMVAMFVASRATLKDTNDALSGLLRA